MDNYKDNKDSLILSAEACPEKLFEKLHCFSRHEEELILSLLAHGPVLVQGSRGSDRSVLLRETRQRLLCGNTHIFSVYMNLKYLIQSKVTDYERIFCESLIEEVRREFEEREILTDFSPNPDAASLRKALMRFGSKFKKRVILFLDDAVHIGMEMASAVFFDIFKTLSCSTVSCKAMICPAFANSDLFTVASVSDISRDGAGRSFTPFFSDVMEARYPGLSDKISRTIRKEDAVRFMERAVVGNMRAFLLLCDKIQSEGKIGLKELETSLINLSSCYYRPLLEELKPDLGTCEPMTEPAKALAERLFSVAEQSGTTSVVIHHRLADNFMKPLEILEHAGFVALRQMARPMKFGGRGVLFGLSLCGLLEIVKGRELTRQRFDSWLNDAPPAEIGIKSDIADIKLPDLLFEKQVPSIADLPIEQLTQQNIAIWKSYGINTIGDIIERMAR